MFKYLILLFLSLSMTSIAEDTVIETGIEAESPAQEYVEATSEHKTKNAKVQILNKITAKSHYVEVPVNSQIIFGTIKIKIFNCLKSSPYDLLENKILLNISEKKIGQDDYSVIFNGWMFSSSPSITSLEHAVYDVTAVTCFE
jgi:hypothetical protein